MKVMLATDGSDFSRNAAQACCELFGKNSGVEIRIVSVYEDVPVLASEPFALAPEYYQDMVDAAKKQAEHFAQEAAEIFRSSCPDAAITTAIPRGKPATRIVDLANSWPADIVVVGSHGRGFWGRLLGSVSSAIVHHAPCTVVIVRGDV
ncbi:MAG: universal stress protein [Blastocatellia bacterium]|nr:universal stress protein [Blastocatellia bacterium]